MATKKFIIEVEEGDTSCRECPIIADCDEPGMCGCTRLVNCCDYNLATIKIKEYEDKN